MVTPTPTPPDPPDKSGPGIVTRVIGHTGPTPAADAPHPSAVTVAGPTGQSTAPRTLVETPEPLPPAVRPAARLVVIRGECPDSSFALLDGKNLIGRTADFAVDIDLDGQEPPERTWASRRHAAVIVEAGGVVVEDLHSLNGTFVNRARLHPGQRRHLHPGDVLQIGTVQLKLVVG